MTLKILKIIRPVNLIFIAVCVCFGGFLGNKNFVSLQLFLSTIALVLTASAGYVLNDVYDVKIDEINKPKRVLPSALLSIGKAKILILLLFFSALATTFFIQNLTAKIIILSSIVLCFLYSAILKETLFWGNLSIGILTALSFTLGEVSVTGKINFSLLPSAFAFFFNISREILKDIVDIEGDKIGKRNTFPIRFSVLTSQKIAVSFLFAVVLLSPLPYLFFGFSKFYLLTIFFAVDLIILKWCFDLWFKNKNNIQAIQKRMKISMLFVLIALFFGKIQW
ncbi:geranylgeranylglycerol-phosphate geranylgeranyltransferase [bacterium]|nr:geranylgeranylglycerol-phosphate geranylgeranyltransferase [bacterium]